MDHYSECVRSLYRCVYKLEIRFKKCWKKSLDGVNHVYTVYLACNYTSCSLYTQTHTQTLMLPRGEISLMFKIINNFNW